MKKAFKITIKNLEEDPYASIICYPKPNKAEFKGRLKELQELGVTALEFVGEREVFNIPVLGKGCVGIVIIAHRDREKAALKIRRADADRSQMQREAEMLRKSNSVNVGPKLLCVSKNFLLMHFLSNHPADEQKLTDRCHV